MSSSQMVLTQPASGSSHRAVAPAWHTVTVLFVLFGFSLAGALITPNANGHVFDYLLVIAMEWAMVAFIWYGASRRNTAMAEIVGGRWARPVDFLRDLGIAIGFLVVSHFVLAGLAYLLKASNASGVKSILPHGGIEIILWLVMSLTAGFCEEVIFRGYFQRQFAALTQAVAGGIVLQGIAFGASHGYQGWKMMLIISVFGCMFGVLAHWRRSLRPGMIGHFLQDGVGGLVASYLLR
jgi:uncharacterized protein